MIKLTQIYHNIIQEKKNIQVSVDMTCGHGNDTLFLSHISKKVYAFDIQEVAMIEAKNLTKTYDNIQYILDNHEAIDQYIYEGIDVCIYNLGYLPNHDHSIITQTSSTLNSLEKVLKLLNKDGLVIIELYPHNQEEMYSILAYTKTLDNEFDVLKIELFNKNNPPILITIKKN